MTDTPPKQILTPTFDTRIPDGDDRERMVCRTCNWVHYDNPKVVVGSVVRHDDQILLCRRAIAPRAGYWTLPAGFLELNETATQGALREAWEEARAKLVIDRLLAVYSIPRISQIQLIYRATLPTAQFAPGPESMDVALFDWADIPWDDLAFPSVHWALTQARSVWDTPAFAPFANPDDALGDATPA